VKVVRTVLRGGRGIYLKPSPLPDCPSFFTKDSDGGLPIAAETVNECASLDIACLSYQECNRVLLLQFDQ